MASAVTCGCFELTGLFRLLDAKGSKMLPVLSTVEAQLSLNERNIANAAPEAWEWQETGG